MSNMPSVNKVQISVRLDLKTCRRVEKEYSRPNDAARNIAYIRALEEATRDIALTAEDYELIAQMARANAIKRGLPK